jgi:predicted DNA-binding transcriptional regulator AlpA
MKMELAMAKKKASAAVVRLGIAALILREDKTERTIRRWYTEGDFPKPHYMGAHRAWFLSEVEAWEVKRMARPRPDRRGARELSGKETPQSSTETR